MAKYNMLCK